MPELIKSLKFFKNNCKSDVICSGLMLGTKINEVSSFPTSYVETSTIYPLSFKEFLIASNIKEEISETIHNRFLELFKDCLICGGMPESVNYYLKSELSKSINNNRRLYGNYIKDIAKYVDSNTKIKAIECFDSIHLQLSKENKKFQYNLVKKGYNARYYNTSLTWLINNGLVCKTNKLKTINFPLGIYKDLSIFKIYLFDTGLLISQFNDAIISNAATNNIGIYNKVIYENSVTCIVNSLNIKNYYYEPNCNSGTDFIAKYDNIAIPLEIKSGKHMQSKSFTDFIKNHNNQITFRSLQKNLRISENNNTLYLPIYTLPFIFEDLKINERIAE